MLETIESSKAEAGVERLEQEFKLALVEVENAAAAVGKFESGRDEVDLGMSENLEAAKEEARAKFEALMEALVARGEKEGIDSREGELDFKV